MRPEIVETRSKLFNILASTAFAAFKIPPDPPTIPRLYAVSSSKSWM